MRLLAIDSRIAVGKISQKRQHELHARLTAEYLATFDSPAEPRRGDK